MGQVYRESLCTIAACLGDSCEAGLFSIRDAATLPSPRCLVAEGGSSKMGFILEPKVDQWSCNVERATLNTRGWVLQERILSKRTIFCTREGFFWQCDKKYSSELKDTMDRESGQELVPKLDDLVKAWRAPATEFNFNSTGKVTTKKFTFLQSFFTQPQSRNVEARPWHQLLYDFTRRGLTNQEDRVSAIRGIGTCFATLAKDIYIANGGIWRSDAIGGLAWFRQWDAPSKRLSAAPSWSWASVSGQITSMYKRTGHVVDIATINWDKTIFTSQNPTISISELHIKGPVCRIRIYDPPQYNIYPATDVDAPRPKPIEIPKGKAFGIFNRNFDTKRLSGVISAGGITEHVGWQTGNKYIQKDHYEIVFDAEGEEGRMDQEYLCMPLVSAAFKVPSTQSFAMGVVLVPAGIEGKGNAYKRVGWAFMWRALEDHRIRNTEVIIV